MCVLGRDLADVFNAKNSNIIIIIFLCYVINYDTHNIFSSLTVLLNFKIPVQTTNM